MVVRGLVILHELLHHRLPHHGPVLGPHLAAEHHAAAALGAELSQQAALQHGPHLVGEVEYRSLGIIFVTSSVDIIYGDLECHDEGDPLVEGGVGAVVLAGEALLVHYTLEVGLQQDMGTPDTMTGTWYLVLPGDVGGAVDPAVVLRQLQADPVEFAAENMRSETENCQRLLCEPQSPVQIIQIT